MKYVAKTTPDKVYLRGLLKDEQDHIPDEFLKYFAVTFGKYVGKSFLVDIINGELPHYEISREAIDWLCRQGVIQLVLEEIQVGDYCHLENFDDYEFAKVIGILNDVYSIISPKNSCAFTCRINHLKKYKNQDVARQCFEMLQKLYINEKEIQ